VGYYLVTGQPVFEGGSPVQLIARHLSAEPVPPSVRVEREIPKALDRVILACLAKNPADRPADAAALARALTAIEVERWGDAEARQWWEEDGLRSAGSRIRG
jgi:serine/threonine-protein kinase